MSSVSKKNLALEMAQCPNCGYAVDQVGGRTNCAKCGKQLTVRCISCDTNNPPIFHLCMKCGSDFRMHAVEHFSRLLSKVEFDIAEHQRFTEMMNRAAAARQVGRIALYTTTALTALVCWLFSSLTVMIAVPLILFTVGQTLLKLFGHRWSYRLADIPDHIAREWTQLCLAAAKDQAKKLELEQQLIYYQRELNQFRSRGHQSSIARD